MAPFININDIEPHSALEASWPGHTVWLETERYGVRTFKDEEAAHAWVDRKFPIPSAIKPIYKAGEYAEPYRRQGYTHYVEGVAPNQPRFYFDSWNAARAFAQFDADHRGSWLIELYADREA